MAEALYRQVAAVLREAIATGAYGELARLPSESELALEHGVSRGTVRQAFAALATEGVIASRQGARRVVLASRAQSFAELRSFSLWARSIGAVPSGKVVSLVRRAGAEREVRELELRPGDQLYYLTRVRLLDGQPVMIERTAYPEWVGELLSGVDAACGSITEALGEHGVNFVHADHVIDAMPATAEDARLLDVRPGYPLLRTRRRTVDERGVPVEWSDDRHRGDAVVFSVHNSASATALSREPQ